MLYIKRLPLRENESRDVKHLIAEKLGFKKSEVRVSANKTGSLKNSLNVSLKELETLARQGDYSEMRALQKKLCDLLVAEGYDWTCNRERRNKLDTSNEKFWTAFNGSSQICVARLKSQEPPPAIGEVGA